MKRWRGVAMIALLPAASWSSSDDAWEAFRAAVDQSCRALVEAPEAANVTVEVNPFGSQSYGAAVVTVGVADGIGRMICIFDKRTGTSELTGPFAEGTAMVPRPGSAAEPLGQP